MAPVAADCLYRKKINLSKSLASQTVGVKEVDSGIWLVSFMDYDPVRTKNRVVEAAGVVLHASVDTA